MARSKAMGTLTGPIMTRLLQAAAVVVILKVTASVVAGYRHYLPPDFASDFLLGREAYFFGAYRWAFYAHLVAGPVTLLVGALLFADSISRRWPRWHRRLGRLQVGCILLVLVPSGLWMAPYAMGGPVSAIGLTLLAIATGSFTVLGWRAAVSRRFDEHRRWVWRTYLLLCSAVVIRLIGGLATVLHIDAEWVYPVSIWVSWLAPLVGHDLLCLRREALLPMSSRLKIALGKLIVVSRD